MKHKAKLMHTRPPLGFVQWFPFQETDMVEHATEVMLELGIKDLRTCFSWADWERPGGQEWFDWLVKKLLVADIRIFPSVFYTPKSHALLPPEATRETALTAFPPQDPRAFVAYVQTIVERYGHAFEWMLLWNEANNNAYWRSDLDAGGRIFQAMMDGGMRALHAAGKKAVIGSLIPPYTPWMEDMQRAGLLQHADAIGIHDFPGTWNDKKRVWRGWKTALREVCDLALPGQEIWVTETGYSTRTLEDPENPTVQEAKEDEQLDYFMQVNEPFGADRVFWYSIFDQEPGHMTDNERNRPDTPPHDPRADGLGIIKYDGRPKKLYFELRKRRVYSY